MDETIKICRDHQDQEETPLIWTFAFSGAEYWCPACGCNYGMLGAGDNVPFTWILHNRFLKYKAKSRKYLRAKSYLCCDKIRYRVKWMKFKDMPERAQTYWRNRAKEWKYKF